MTEEKLISPLLSKSYCNFYKEHGVVGKATFKGSYLLFRWGSCRREMRLEWKIMFTYQESFHSSWIHVNTTAKWLEILDDIQMFKSRHTYISFPPIQLDATSSEAQFWFTPNVAVLGVTFKNCPEAPKRTWRWSSHFQWEFGQTGDRISWIFTETSTPKLLP